MERAEEAFEELNVLSNRWQRLAMPTGSPPSTSSTANGGDVIAFSTEVGHLFEVASTVRAGRT